MKTELCLLGLTWVCSLNATELIVDNGFEKGDLSGFADSGNPPSVVTNLVAEGRYSGNFDLTRSMTSPYRTEVTLKDSGIFEWHTEYWVGFSFRFEEWATDTDMEIAPFQIHPTPTSWDTWDKCGLGSQIMTGPVMMAVQRDEMRVYTFGGKIAWRAPIVRKQWMHATLRFIPSTNHDGLIEMWMDGVKMVHVAGTNSHGVDKCGTPMRPHYWKMGIYKWNWKTGRPATDSTRRQLLIDELKLAKGTDGYSLVSPKSPQILSHETKAR